MGNTRIRAVSILVAAVLVQLCLGGIYAWSAIAAELQRDHPLSGAQAQLIFGTCIAVFTIVMVGAGQVLERVGPQKITILGGILVGAGFVLASLSQGRFPMLLAGMGVIAGAGIGCAYVCPLATAVRWFPRHRGLVTGLTVAGMGGGAILLNIVITRLLAAGMGILPILTLVGIGYGAIIIAGGSLLRFPVKGQFTETAQGGACYWRDLPFWGMVIGMFCGTFAGLLVVGNLKLMGLSWQVPEALATLAVSLFAVGNALGRLGWGALADRFGTRTTTAAMLLLGAVALGALPLAAQSGLGFAVATVAIALSFGGCFVLFAANVAGTYGSDRLQLIYPWIFLAYGTAALCGPAIGGWLHDRTETYTLAAFIACAVCVLGAAGFWGLSSPTPQVADASATPRVRETA